MFSSRHPTVELLWAHRPGPSYIAYQVLDTDECVMVSSLGDYSTTVTVCSLYVAAKYVHIHTETTTTPIGIPYWLIQSVHKMRSDVMRGTPSYFPPQNLKESFRLCQRGACTWTHGYMHMGEDIAKWRWNMEVVCERSPFEKSFFDRFPCFLNLETHRATSEISLSRWSLRR